MTDNIAILGAGNAGHAMAADLSLAGFNVRLYEHPKLKQNVEQILRTKEIELIGTSIARVDGMIAGREGSAKVDKITTDLEEAIKDVKIINFQMPAYADEIIFKELAPILRPEQIVVFWAGYFRTLRIGHVYGEILNRKGISLWETNTQPFSARIKAPGIVEINQTMDPVFYSKYLCLENDADHRIQELEDSYPLQEIDNVLLVSLINPNTYVHPAGVLLNAGRIEYSKGDFNMYREGITPGVGLVIKKLDEEIQSIIKALNFSAKLPNQGSFWREMIRVIGMGDIVGPQSLKSRYITEDIPYSLVPIAQLGDKLQINASIAHALVEIGSAVCKDNYWVTGRNLESLGLNRLKKEEIVSMFTKRTA